jgi:hypothetical protein
MRIGSVIAKKIDGTFEAVEVGTDIDGMKKRMKEMKVNEADGNHTAVYLMINASKKFKLKPEIKPEAKAKKGKGEK